MKFYCECAKLSFALHRVEVSVKSTSYWRDDKDVMPKGAPQVGALFFLEGWKARFFPDFLGDSAWCMARAFDFRPLASKAFLQPSRRGIRNSFLRNVPLVSELLLSELLGTGKA